jgi:hypothetical protein
MVKLAKYQQKIMPETYSLQRKEKGDYLIKFVSDLRQVTGFLHQ